MSRPGISVVIPVYNGAETLGEQLRAVLDQRVNCDFEVVVADNGSTDETAAIVEGFACTDDRIRLVDASAVPRSGAGAKNIGVEAARSPLLAFCDADDLVAPGWLQEVVDGLQEFQVVHAATERWHFNPELRVSSPQYHFGGAYGGVPVVAGGAFGVHRELYLSIGGFDAGFPGTPDTEFGIRLFKHTRVPPAELPGAVIHLRLPTSCAATYRRARAFGRSYRHLTRRHGDVVNRRGVKIMVANIIWLVRRSPRAALGNDRMAWVWRLAITVGQVESYLRPTLARGPHRSGIAPSGPNRAR